MIWEAITLCHPTLDTVALFLDTARISFVFGLLAEIGRGGGVRNVRARNANENVLQQDDLFRVEVRTRSRKSPSVP
jgi:hypothetical protein